MNFGTSILMNSKQSINLCYMSIFIDMKCVNILLQIEQNVETAFIEWSQCSNCVFMYV